MTKTTKATNIIFMNIRVDEELKELFLEHCKKMESTASMEMRKFMRREIVSSKYIKLNAEQKRKYT